MGQHYTIEGIGVNIDHIRYRLNKKKLIEFLIEQLPIGTVDDLKEIYSEGEPYEGFDIDDYLYGNPYDGIEEILASCDDNEWLTYNDNGEGSHYVYFPKSYPWERARYRFPRSVEEVKFCIVGAIQKVTDMTENEILAVINEDIYDYGWS